MGSPITVGSMIGVDFNNSSSSQLFALNTRANGTQDTLFVYVEANGTFVTGNCVSITTGGTAVLVGVSAGQGATSQMIGFAQSSFTSGYFGWIARNGNAVYVLCSGTTNPSATLYSAVGAGKIHTTSASSTLVGVVLLAVASASETGILGVANLTWPKFNTVGM